MKAFQAPRQPRLAAVASRRTHWQFLMVWGPGLLVTLADTDVGNIVTAAQGGAQWGYRLLLLVLALIPMLYMVQELTVRLGIFTGMGLAELILARYGKLWSRLSVGVLAVATIGSLITEFTGVAAVGELYGVSRTVSLSLASTALFSVVFLGSYRRIEKIALVFGLFELAFFGVAWMAHPDVSVITRQSTDFLFKNHQFMFLASALIGSVFNPWMIFYQQSAVADKGLTPDNYASARWDTASGAVLTQCITAAVVIATAATFDTKGSTRVIHSIGDVSDALIPLLGGSGAHLVFSAGVMGAAMVAAIVSSLALAWGISEAAGYVRAKHSPGSESPWFYAVYALCIVGSAWMVGSQANLIGLDVATQVVNTGIFPILIAVLLLLAQTVLPTEYRLRGWYLWVLVMLAVLVSGIGLWGGLAPFV
ncbi:divalent metal cation transporter [Rhodoferax sp.]|uniref:NRAMP family divalent metal transporter n=1 Tax=Rhodoferax sp. TaxID=50421 RepID=UPI00283DB77F|nr:divalent metal cation transporter [Rhodoferax sp.]MDR3368383.1 divalent metal cation transporter [Rhodoferax sp.]